VLFGTPVVSVAVKSSTVANQIKSQSPTVTWSHYSVVSNHRLVKIAT